MRDDNGIIVNLKLTLSESQLEEMFLQIIQPLIARAFAQAEEKVKASKPLKELESQNNIVKHLGVGNAKFKDYVNQGLPQTERIPGEILYRPAKVFEFLDKHTTNF